MALMLTQGTPVKFRSAADRKLLVGKEIVYLRTSDIDRSGRGYFFPQFGKVSLAADRQLQLDSGRSIYASDLVEVNLIGEP